MKVTVAEDFNIFELFVHDNEAIQAVCPYALAEAINEHLVDWQVMAPESLDRFTLFSTDDEDERYIERYYSVQQVKDALPAEAVEQLEAINDMELNLSAGSSPT